MSFSDLAPELIRELWKHVLGPDEVRSFALVSRLVYDAGSHTIRRYHEWRKEYGSLESLKFKGRENPFSVSVANHMKLSHFAKQLSLAPHLGLYLRHLCLGHWQNEWDWEMYFKPPDPQGPYSRYSSQEIELFKATLSTLLRPEKVDRWFARLEEGDDSAIVLIILHLCPNILVLDLAVQIQNERDVLTLLEDSLIDSRPGLTILQNVEKLDLEDTRRVNILVALIIFIDRLPALKSIHARAFYNETLREPLVESSLPLSSKLEILSIADAGESLNEECLSLIFRRLPALRNFEYRVFLMRSDDTARLCKLITSHRTRQTLENLAIHSTGIKEDDKEEIMPDFSGLTRLQSLSTPIGISLSNNRPLIELKLPPSLQNLSMPCPALLHATDFNELMSALITAKQHDLGKLSSVTLAVRESDAKAIKGHIEDAKKRCSEAGFRVDIFKRDGES